MQRRGAALVEFALVAVTLYLLIAAILTFGQAIFSAQVLQQTADVFSHELARTPLPPTETLDAALADTNVQNQLFNENDLDLDVTDWIDAASGSALANLTLDQYLAQATTARPNGVPLVNRLLAPLMIIDHRADGTYHLWYPGSYTGTDGHAYVNVLTGTSGGFLPHRVIEPITNNVSGTSDLFPLSLTDGTVSGGMAGVRVNYAFQSASLSSMYTVGTSAGGQPLSSYVPTNGEAPDPKTTPGSGSTTGGLYAGPNYLGQQFVAGQTVRPFQRLISAQAVYRREVFGNE